MTDTRSPRLPKRTSRWWSYPLVGVAGVVLAAIVVAALLPSRWVSSKEVGDGAETSPTPFALVPAGAEAVADRVVFGPLPAEVDVDTELDGLVHFVTVAEPAQSALGWWVADPEQEIQFRTYEEKYPAGQTPAERRQTSLQLMANSEQVAQFVALQAAGFEPDIVVDVAVQAALCVEVDDEGFCDEYDELREELRDGDVIVAVDGEEFDGLTGLADLLADLEPGDEIEVRLLRAVAGELETVDVTIELWEHPDDPDRAIIGFTPLELMSLDLPFEVAIETGQIGGDSAGLAFTLTLIDHLTEGALLGGADVAVTGRINLDGTVGAIGGLVQKASAVRQAGIGTFIVPDAHGDAELDLAREVAGDDVEIVTVADIDEALDALAALGGDVPRTARG